MFTTENYEPEILSALLPLYYQNNYYQTSSQLYKVVEL